MPVTRSSSQFAPGQFASVVRPRWNDVPSGVIAVPGPRATFGNTSLSLTSAQLRVSGVGLVPAGTLVTSVTVWSSGTAAVTPTAQWFAIFDALTRAKIQVTVDDTSTAFAANTGKTLNLAATWTPAADTLITVGAVMAAATPISLITSSAGTLPHMLTVPVAGGNADAALTNPASCPATYATPATGAASFWWTVQ